MGVIYIYMIDICVNIRLVQITCARGSTVANIDVNQLDMDPMVWQYMYMHALHDVNCKLKLLVGFLCSI